MSYVVFARRYRPSTFDEVVGQGAVARTLRNAIENDRVGHAYLFCGPRGVGKTSMARIFARALNCEQGPTTDPCGECEPCRSISAGTDVDVIEIDGASNRGVEDARRLRQGVAIAPSRSSTKVYIIDEVHMLTTESFNTLLKTLEEPPPHVKFVLATTEPHKILDTIISRCQRFDFRRIGLEDIVMRLKQICEQEGCQADESVLRRIARSARGGMRDSQSLLDQLNSFTDGNITDEHLERILGRLGEDELLGVIEKVVGGDAAAGIAAVAELYERGLDPEAFLEQTIEALRGALIVKACGAEAAGKILDETDDLVLRMGTISQSMDAERIQSIIAILLETSGRMRRPGESQPRLLIELAIFQMAASAETLSPGEILRRIERMEGGGGSATPPAAKPPPSPAGGSGGRGGGGSSGSSGGGSSRGRSSGGPPPPPPAPTSGEARGAIQATAPQGKAPARTAKAATPETPPDSHPSGAASQPAAIAIPGLDEVAARWRPFVEAVEVVDHVPGALLRDSRPTAIQGACLEFDLPAGYEFHGSSLATAGARLAITPVLREAFPGLEEYRAYVAGVEAQPRAETPLEFAPAAPLVNPGGGKPRGPRSRMRDIEKDPNVAAAMRELNARVINVEEA